jgi:hypothetical protein
VTKNDRNGEELKIGDYARGWSGSIYRISDLDTSYADSIRAEIILATDGANPEPRLDNLTKISPEMATFLVLGGDYTKARL